ncbi:OprO/OprP family phosphate-selective porin [Flammeovirga yaeyamensis]|uniref:OprO/OprP family phosphate-selective porin n=1 Tax=Flammeovirga yaeyamensis TaxID=367791 RepID=A0AAX1NFE5_9BACT|nr:hypothetical protein [Flammeovirga yaeyamensis]MBB3697211.1 hypothetical protein [Flammeovirga yaeyamensis]NMF33872.1 hypothetical protein [Flammeovirga yaeyamensis]QWG04868.1 OprO/OprP family phosphate-selective porin [Flammeovirga yaeyamensis]
MKKLLSFCLILFSSLHLSFASDDPKQNLLNESWKSFQDSLKFTLDSRLDFQNTRYQEQFDPYYNDQRFQFSNFRIGLEGKFNQYFGFQFLYSPNDARVGMNNLNDDILYANVHYTTHNGRWHFKAGRSFLNVGTVEQTYNPNDVYTYSIVGNQLGVFKTGVTSEYRSKTGQRVGMQIVNANVDSLGQQINLQYNFYWYGRLMDDKIKTFASYTTINDLSKSFSSTPYAINLGIQWSWNNWQLDTDYAYVKNMPNFTDNAIYQSVPIRLMYYGKKFRPYIKYIYDNIQFNSDRMIDKINGDHADLQTANIHTLEVALQYYPFPDKNFRFHLVGAYASDTHQYKTDDQNEFFNSRIRISAGVRIGLDMIRGW